MSERFRERDVREKEYRKGGIFFLKFKCLFYSSFPLLGFENLVLNLFRHSFKNSTCFENLSGNFLIFFFSKSPEF